MLITVWCTAHRNGQTFKKAYEVSCIQHALDKFDNDARDYFGTEEIDFDIEYTY